MIKIPSDNSHRTPWWPQSVVSNGWRRLWLLGSVRHYVRGGRRRKPWTIWQQRTRVFSGSKQQCEDWLDWQDRQTRKAVGK